MTVSNYLELLIELGVEQSDRVIALLPGPGKRGFLIG